MATLKNVISYGGGPKPGQRIVGNTADGQKTTLFDAATSTSASYAFAYTALSSWDLDLPNLIDANCMFSNCTKLRSFRGALPSLKNAACMFYGVQNCDLSTVAFPALLNASSMFASSSCDLSDAETFATVTDAKGMFYRSSTMPPSVITLENATDVFQAFDIMTVVVRNLPNLNLSKITQEPGNLARGAAFNLETVRAIASTLPNRSGQTAWNITIGVDATLRDDAAVQADLQAILDKNYVLKVQYNA